MEWIIHAPSLRWILMLIVIYVPPNILFGGLLNHWSCVRIAPSNSFLRSIFSRLEKFFRFSILWSATSLFTRCFLTSRKYKGHRMHPKSYRILKQKHTIYNDADERFVLHVFIQNFNKHIILEISTGVLFWSNWNQFINKMSFSQSLK